MDEKKGALRMTEESKQEEISIPEIEGGSYTWFFVCGECRQIVYPEQGFCENCGRRLKWDAK